MLIANRFDSRTLARAVCQPTIQPTNDRSISLLDWIV